MRNTIIFLIISMLTLFVISCGAKKEAIDLSDITEAEKRAFNQTEGDTIHIKSDSIAYEIIIIEPGFNTWFQSMAKPEGYYSQSFLESRNRIMVVNWNQRVLRPFRFDATLYEMQIDYQNHIDYGYEVNYKLYNYFIYFQRKYRQRLGPFSPRI